jgi:hypothetical protein
MFLFPDFLCFDSRLIAHETTITIPYRVLAEVRAPVARAMLTHHFPPFLRSRVCDLAQVTKKKTLGIPNALEIVLGGESEGACAGLKL